MKTLMKVKLINWHTFVNQEFPVYKNSLITGENATGKSTILDALQYVLTVGKCKFNKAASDIGNRTLESYIRCKTGVEGKEYKREGDVSSYIALEFYDEKTLSYQIIGVAIDLLAGGKPIREFFQIINTKIEDVTFIENKKVLTRREFKSTLNKHSQLAIFKETIKDSQRLFSNSLGVKDKYFELVTKALAFKAIEKVYQFIMEFLLKEDFVDIENLRQSILHYKILEEQLKISQKECVHLSDIIKEYKEYENIHYNIKVIDFAKEKLIEKKLIYMIDNANYSKQKLSSKLNTIDSKSLIVEQNCERYMKQLNTLTSSMKPSENLQLKIELQRELDVIKKEKDKNKNNYISLVNDIKKESSLMKKLKIQKSFINYVLKEKFTSEELNNSINDIINYIVDKRNELDDEIKDIKRQIVEDINLYNEKITTFDLLKDNRLTYRTEINELIELLKDKLFAHYGKHIEVKPLCEYLEIKDENWRNAVEGYLNTQRFDIIIDPEYFEYSILVYEEYKNIRGIYGVGIVDVAKLKKYENVNIIGTLADKITPKNTYAKWYINMLLRNVKCVEDAKQLRNYKTAITESVMLYKNYTVKALNPRIYKKPFIGLKAIKIQKLILEKEIKSLKEKMGTAREYLKELEDNQKLIESSNANKIQYRLALIDEYQFLLEQFNDLKSRIDNIELDDSILAILGEIDNVSGILDELKVQRKELDEQRGSIRGKLIDLEIDLETNKENLKSLSENIVLYEMDHVDIAQKSDELVVDYQKEYFRNYTEIDKQIEIKRERCNHKTNRLDANIVMHMIQYNKDFNIGFENSLKAIDDYVSKYHQLRDIDIVKKMELARQAKLKSEETFKTSFVSGLSEKIENAKRDIQILNKGLSKRDFNGETYEFCVTATTKTNFREYYDIIQTGKEYVSNNLLSEMLDESQRRIMDGLFEKLSNVENDKETEKMLVEYTDYRNYLDYDIKIKYADGTFAFFSKVNREKSGGETQTPFYVIMAASFEQIVKDRNANEDFACVVLFDEAFNNMDENRIQEMIKFYNERDIQTFIAVPPSRANNIIPYVNTRLLTVKQNDRSFVEVITDERI